MKQKILIIIEHGKVVEVLANGAVEAHLHDRTVAGGPLMAPVSELTNEGFARELQLAHRGVFQLA